MAAGPKTKSKRRGAEMTARRSAGAKPASQIIAVSPSGQRKVRVRSGTIGKQGIPEPVRGRATVRRKAGGIRGATRTDSALITRLETIARDLGQIADMRAELADLRAVIEELVQTVAALTADNEAQGGGIEQSPAENGEVLVVETHGVPANGEEPEPQGAAQG